MNPLRFDHLFRQRLDRLCRLCFVLALLKLPMPAVAQTWTTINPLNTAEGAPGVATGPDGKVYVIGGVANNGIATDNVEAYDPSTRIWTNVASLNTPRGNLAATTGPDGKLYAIGGVDSSFNVSGVVEAYDPSTNIWTPVASLHTPRQYLAAATGPDGKLYAIGGYDSNNQVTGVVEAYNTATHTWTTVASLHTPRSAVGAATGPDGKLYAIGGQDSHFNPSGVVEAYDITTKTWTTVASLNTARYGLAATTGSDGKLYAIGGQDGSFSASSVVETYDTTTHTWTTIASLNTARFSLAAATGPNGKVYSIGGRVNSGNISNAVEAGFIEIAPLQLTISTSAPSTITVKLGAPAPATGLLLTLSSSDTAAATLPNTLFISPGNTGASAGITPGGTPDPAVILSATYQGKTVSGSYAVRAPLALTSLGPNPIMAAGPDLTLTVNGTGFVNGSQVTWNGKKRATTYISSTQLMATILASDIAKVGSAKVGVTNPNTSGGGMSNDLSVSIVTALLQQQGHKATRNPDGSVSVAVEVFNSGSAPAQNAQLTTATLGGVSGTPLPQSIGTVGVKEVMTVTTTYPNPGAKGTKVAMTLSGSFTGGSWKSAFNLLLP